MIQIHLSRFTLLNNFFLLFFFYFFFLNIFFTSCLQICCISMCLYFYHYPVYFYRFVFKILHCFTACTDDETSISKRLNKDDNFTNRLRFNLPNSSAIQAK